MRQTIVSVVLPVALPRVPDLSDAIDAFRTAQMPPPARTPGATPSLAETLPGLHFLSLVVFNDTAGISPGEAHVTPQFVLEANTDGAPGPFFAALEAAFGPDLRALLRLCAPPLGASDALFLSVTAPGARTPLAPLLERQAVFPAASHMGNRGLSCPRILRQDALYTDAESMLPPPPSVFEGGAPSLHAWLRAALLPRHPWLADAPIPPVTRAERTNDIASLAGFAVLAVVLLLLPWLLFAILAGPTLPAMLACLAGIASLTGLRDIGMLALLVRPKPLAHVPLAIAVIFGLLLLAALFRPTLAWPALLLGGLLSSFTLLLAALRHRERTDPQPPEAQPDPIAVHDMRNWEDLHAGGSDHMASLVLIKPGRLRALLLHAGMAALTRAVRVQSTNGYLGSMRTIHFAHWAIMDHGRRLLFCSNFDGSWESYLDDFIEKAHAGLTLAWGNAVGFPPCDYLVLRGATQGRRFKAWARCSMTESRFWYSAYPTRTVNQIARQYTLAEGLRAETLAPQAASDWAKAL